MNAERTWHYHRRAKHDTEWREAFALLAREARIPHLETCSLVWTHERPNRSAMPDTVACAPSAKAALDGLRDAGVIDDDCPQIVLAQTFRVLITGRHALACTITER